MNVTPSFRCSAIANSRQVDRGRVQLRGRCQQGDAPVDEDAAVKETMQIQTVKAQSWVSFTAHLRLAATARVPWVEAQPQRQA